MHAGELDDVVSFLVGRGYDVAEVLQGAIHSGKVQGSYRRLLPLKPHVDSQLAAAMQAALHDESIFEELCSITRIVPKHVVAASEPVQIVTGRREARHRYPKAWTSVYGAPKIETTESKASPNKKTLPQIFKRRYGKLLVISR